MSAMALVQKLSRLKPLLLQFLDSKLELVASLCRLVVLLGDHPSHQAVGALHLPVPNTLLILQWPVAWRSEMKSVKSRESYNQQKHMHTFSSEPCKLCWFVAYTICVHLSAQCFFYLHSKRNWIPMKVSPNVGELPLRKKNILYIIISGNFGKYAHLLSFWELDERINTTWTSVCLIWS